MEIIGITLDGFHVVLSLNWVGVLILALLVGGICYLLHWIASHSWFKTIQIEEATIGIGNSSVTVKYDSRIKEIAYKIWIELTTRKIGIEFDVEHDVIIEIYDSWYESFRIIRALLEEIPANRIDDAQGLIDITTKVLNQGLRPHLTRWQARFRAWYQQRSSKEREKSPQELQKEFPDYQLLVKDLSAANKILGNYANELKRIIDNSSVRDRSPRKRRANQGNKA